MLIAVGVVTYVACSYRVCTEDPMIAEVSSAHDFQLKLPTGATLQLFHHLLSAIYL